MNNPEIIINLWAIHDPDVNVIYGLAGRTYYASGTDEEKTALLKQLAVSDFVLATRMPVPDRFNVESEGETLNGYCKLNELYNPKTTLFKELFLELESEMVSRFKADTGGDDFPEFLKISDNPLYIVTALVEDEDGSIRAVTGD